MAQTKIRKEQISGGLDGWIPANETWTYASATTFTISGDLTGKYQKGDKIKFSQATDGVKYMYIVGVSYSSPNTTVTVTGGDDYDLDNEAITSNYFSKVENPQGFPAKFDFTPSYGAASSMTYTSVTTVQATFWISGSTCFFTIRSDGTTGGTASSYITATLPVTPIQSEEGALMIKDGSDAVGFYQLSSIFSGFDIAFFKYDGSNWGLGAARRCRVNSQYMF